MSENERTVTLLDGRTIQVRGEKPVVYWLDDTPRAWPPAGWYLASPDMQLTIEEAERETGMSKMRVGPLV